MTSGVLDPARCPVCGADNECGLVAGRNDCWCASAEVSDTVLAALSERGIGGVACLCPSCLSGEVPSPCIKLCRLDETGEVCVGCHRTLDEIGQWSRGTAGDRATILVALRERRTPGNG